MTQEQVCCVAPVSILIKPLILSWSPTITSLNHNYLQKGPHPNTVRCDFGDEASKTRTLGRHIETIVYAKMRSCLSLTENLPGNLSGS